MECKKVITICFWALIVSGCYEEKVNLNERGEDKFEALSIDQIPDSLAFYDTTYVSIYSDIYSENRHTVFNLTATLSLRNTSFFDTIYISDVDYYNSAGEMIRRYLEKPIVLGPMQSMEYVVEEKDTTGGTGANFIVNWGSRNGGVKPLFEGVMISTNGQQGISFSTIGISISRRE
jgi:hypothetical protein